MKYLVDHFKKVITYLKTTLGLKVFLWLQLILFSLLKCINWKIPQSDRLCYSKDSEGNYELFISKILNQGYL